MKCQKEILRELDEVDRRARALLDDLDEAQLAVPYSRGINPPVWELGHVAFFYEYFLLRELAGGQARMPGYDDVWDSFEISHKHRWTPGVVPQKSRMLDYYNGVISEARQRLLDREIDAKESYLFRYVIHHHQMHIESLIWARQTLGYPMPVLFDEELAVPGGSDFAGDAKIAGGEFFVGKPPLSSGEFSFDNERPGYRVEVDSFEIAKTLVTNGEFLEFLEEGGYDDESLWDFGGRCWLADRPQEARGMPEYWRKQDDGSFQYRKFGSWKAIPLDAPVLHVSVFEAEAFCRFAGRRLPTELEWEAAARGSDVCDFPWGESAISTSKVDMDGTYFGSAPASAFEDGASESGCLQMLGTAWEWTSNQFLPYAGFEIDMYHYMSVLQFGDHRVTKGGSCATCSGLIRNSYRQAYLPGRTDVFTGFRTCAR